MHNRRLEFVADYCTQYSWLDSTKADSLWKLIAGLNQDEKPVLCSYVDLNSIYLAMPTTPIATAELASWITDRFPNTEVISWIQDLMQLVEDTTSYESFIADVTSLETSFIADSAGMAASDKLLFLGTASVARYSFAYWIDTTRTIWPAEGSTFMSKAEKRKEKIKKVVTADCQGAIEGACTGFLGGLFFGPEAAIWGSLVGFQVGAAWESAKEAYKRFSR